MIDISKLHVGDRLGCRYSFTSGAFGAFSNLSSTPTDGRKVKDPLILDGNYFKPSAPIPDPVMVPLASTIKMLTTRTFKTTDTVLSTGKVSETNEYIDFSLYKSVISFTSTNGVVLTAIPKDVLLETSEMINISDFVTGINSINISASNIFCKVAITLDGTSYYSYDSGIKVWNVIDTTVSTDVLKTAMTDYTVFNTLTATDYAALSLQGKIGFKILIGIDGVDTAKTYTFNGITIDYVGSNDSTPSIQYFNFVFAGYTKEGNAKLIADRNIQTSISYSTLATAGVVYADKKINISNSEIGRDCYMRLLNSSPSSTYFSEYEFLINGTAVPTGGKTNSDFWHTNIASITRTISSVVDDDGVAASASSIIARGGSNITKFNNLLNTVSSPDAGFRPVLIIDLTTPLEQKPGPTLPEVRYLKDLVPGKCISCEYTAPVKGSLGKFKNLGNASKGLLNDFNNPTPDGTFYFNCVGYTTGGGLKLVADRVIQTDISLNNIYTGNTPLIVSGIDVSIDQQAHILRLPNTLSDREPISKGGEYDSVITNALNTNLGIDDIWHTNNVLSLTNTISATKQTKIIVKGFGDESSSRTNQRHISPTVSSPIIGFRPILIVKQAVKVELMVIVPPNTYIKQNKTLEIDLMVTMPDGSLGQYALFKNDDNSILSPYSNATHRSIDVTKLNEGADTIINVFEKTTNKKISSFSIHRDTLYRTSTSVKVGEIYGGYTTNGIEFINAVAKPKISSNTIKPVKELADNSSYVPIPKNAVKITIG